VCGNGVVEIGEECEGSQGSCCNATSCKFLTSSTKCRSANGDCDVEEFCTGFSSNCPPDSYLQENNACKSSLLCDVEIDSTCSGKSPECYAFEVMDTIFGVISISNFDISEHKLH
jgi:hypothetical protein